MRKARVIPLGIGCFILLLVFSQWSGHEDLQEKTKFRMFNMTISAEKWIVVTTVSYPTPDIRFLADIPGWQLVVVGDTKTPSDWRLPRVIFLSIDDQRRLGYKTVKHLPEKSYARKSVGYLFAIAHGAKVIYETDDDNRPLDLLNNFILNSTMWGLSYNGNNVFNPYRHFGQPTLWPRGYPLSSIGENVTTEYILNHYKTPLIQQGVVNGDPDMDAIFRLTRKKTLSLLNVSFDGRAPPVIVPSGVFSPFNSQNTLFLYDAFWALLIPTTTAFRVCDIWRGYWAQRLLWEMGGNLGFFPPNAFQKRNSHSYLLDAMDERDLYFQTERLLTFLKKWKCKPKYSFFECTIQLSTDMVEDKFWKLKDQKLTESWVKDLKTHGYKEPTRIKLSSLKERVHVIKDKRLPNQTRGAGPSSSVVFWAAPQPPPLTYQTDVHNPLLTHIKQITTYCNMSNSKFTIKETTNMKTYPNILLIIAFNHPHYANIPFLETMYRMHFPQIVYCGTSKTEFHKTGNYIRPVSFIQYDIHSGWFAQHCLSQAMKMNYNVDGYLYLGDDTLLNVWNLHNVPWDKLWLIEDTVLRPSVKTNWMWINSPHVGQKRFDVAMDVLKSKDKHKFDKFTKTLLKSTGFPNALYKCPSDIAYVPKKYKDEVLYFMEHFSRFNLFVEIIIPTVFYGVETFDNVFKMPGTYLWYDGKRNHIEKYFNKTQLFLHPVKVLNEFKVTKGRKFFCKTFLPLTLTNL